MKKILVLDDERTLKIEGDVTHVRSSLEACDAMKAIFLAGGELDELWLDHDLGGEDTAKVVVDWLEGQGYYGQPLPVHQIMIHTVNAPAGDTMMTALRKYYTVRRVDIAELSARCSGE